MIELAPSVARWIAGGILILCLAGLAAYSVRLRRAARAFGDPAVIRQLLGVDLARVPVPRLLVVGIAAASLGVAIVMAANPADREAARGPLVLLLDASGSMLVDDMEGTRLTEQRRVAFSILSEIPSVPVGVVTFAGRAFSLTPPTRDRGAVEMYLAAVDPTIVTQSGSAMGAAIRQGLGLLGARARGAGTLVLIGDGDETDDHAAVQEAVDVARQAGIRIHTVGVGSAEGGPVPAVDLTTGEARGYLTGPTGEPIISRIDIDLLRTIADRTGGVAVRADDPNAGPTIGRLVTDSSAPLNGSGKLPPYAWLAMTAVLLLALEPLTDRFR